MGESTTDEITRTAQHDSYVELGRAPKAGVTSAFLVEVLEKADLLDLAVPAGGGDPIRGLGCWNTLEPVAG